MVQENGGLHPSEGVERAPLISAVSVGSEGRRTLGDRDLAGQGRGGNGVVVEQGAPVASVALRAM